MHLWIVPWSLSPEDVPVTQSPRRAPCSLTFRTENRLVVFSDVTRPKEARVQFHCVVSRPNWDLQFQQIPDCVFYSIQLVDRECSQFPLECIRVNACQALHIYR